MKQRILATGVLWALVIALMWFLGKWGAFILIAIFGIGSMWELSILLDKAGHPVSRRVALAAFSILLGAMMLFPPWVIPPMALVFICFSLATVGCLFYAGVGRFNAIAFPTLGAILLMILPFGSITLLIHESEYGLVLTVWVLAVIKFCDVGALLTGMAIGKHKMAPSFSPKKTWEGLGGGVILSVIVSIVLTYVLRDWLPPELTYFNAAWTAALISVAGVMGDLVESAFKREAKVKDSGNSIPGIGGFLDLSDSPMLALPVSYFLIWIIL